MTERQELEQKLDRLMQELEDHLAKHPGEVRCPTADSVSLLIWVTALRLQEMDEAA